MTLIARLARRFEDGSGDAGPLVARLTANTYTSVYPEVATVAAKTAPVAAAVAVTAADSVLSLFTLHDCGS